MNLLLSVGLLILSVFASTILSPHAWFASAAVSVVGCAVAGNSLRSSGSGIESASLTVILVLQTVIVILAIAS